MSVQRLTIDGYGQLELNNVAFRRDGRVEAQCKLDAADFATNPAENGMILAVKKVTKSIELPAADGSDEFLAINYSSEHMYDERHSALKDFCLRPGEFLPRMGYLAQGDLFTTNCVSYDTSDFANDAALKNAVLTGDSAVVIYGSESSDGSILLKKTSKASNKKLYVKAVAVTTMPDGTWALKFQVL